MILAENVIGTSAVMVNKAVLESPLRFDESLDSAEDWDLWLKLAVQGPIGFCKAVDMVYLMRPGSETSRMQARMDSLHWIYRRYAGQLLFTQPKAVLHCRARLLTGAAEHLQAQSRPAAALAYHLLALVLKPNRRNLGDVVGALKAWLPQTRHLIRKLRNVWQFASA